MKLSVTANEKALLKEIVAVTKSTRFFIIGAKARNLLFELYLISGIRATNDWDIALALESWQAFEKIKKELISRGFAETNVEHRLNYKGLVMDIVPFGKLEKKKGLIHFPKSGMEMTTDYFSYALNMVLQVPIDNKIEVPVVSPEAFILLKIMAWMDRKSQDDAKDVRDILEKYEGFADLNTEKNLESFEGNLPKDDYRLTYSALAGVMLATTLSGSEHKKIIATLDSLINDPRQEFIIGMRKSDYADDDDQEFCLDLLVSFQIGLKSI